MSISAWLLSEEKAVIYPCLPVVHYCYGRMARMQIKDNSNLDAIKEKLGLVALKSCIFTKFTYSM